MAHHDHLNEAREKLPIFAAKRELLAAISRNKTVIIVGETACGKTTQIPQFVLEGGLARNKCIVITQPRRLAAISIAKRVAAEMRAELGGKVGFSVRFENFTSSATRIKYVTDGILLREALTDALLLEYSVVILDEAHERTLNNDILFGIVKSAQKLREQNKSLPLKIVVTSATVDYDCLSKYFDAAPAYFVPGREYSITILNANKEQDDYMHSVLVTIFQIHQNEGEGDILVFCPGQEEIDKAVSEIRKISQELPAGNMKIIGWGLYAALPLDLQQDVFKPTPSGCRKVILSTNIAETSVTIPGIKYVIDTGMMKAKSYNSLCGMDILNSQRVSKAQANQRAGRAGREVDGSCYRLFTTKEFEAFEEYAVPEILRCCLASAILQMVGMGIQNIQKFDFIDRPSDDNINAAIRQLKLLDAVTEDDGILEMTECGKKMVKFPLDPRFSKMIITSSHYKCTDEILTIISLLSVDSIFYNSVSQREKFAEARRKFETTDGDHIMMLNVYKAFKNSKGSPGWCHENFINARNVKKAVSIRKQLSQLCEKAGIPPCSLHNDTTKIRKCLASGLFMNAALRIKNKMYRMIDGSQKVKIHPSSCLFKGDPACCICTDLIQTSKVFMRSVSSITEEDLIEVAPAYCKEKKVTGFQLISVKTEEL